MADSPVCGFCKGEPVGDAATWADGKPRPPAPCPRCGETNWRVRELWRTRFVVKNAYVDQTGRSHSGSRVLERILVTDTAERYDVDDGYSVHKGHGVVAVAEDGRRFGLHTETVDYTGGTHVRALDAKRFGVLDTNVAATVGRPRNPDDGHWQVAPASVAGYVYPDGTGPVERLL